MQMQDAVMINALIVTEPGPFRESLQLFLATVTQVETICHVGDALSALKLVMDYHPQLMILDASLPGNGVLPLVKWIKAKGISTRCFVFADDVRQQQRVQDAGADAVLLKGFPAAELFEMIKQSMLQTRRHRCLVYHWLRR
jgi:DNA-binding NarL/FixJ family response regulator